MSESPSAGPSHVDGPLDAASLLATVAALGDLASIAVVPAASNEVLQSIPLIARQAFGAAACSLAVVSSDQDALEYVAASGEGADSVMGMQLPLGRGIAGWAAASGQTLLVGDVGSDPRFARDLAESTGYVPTTLLAVPIVYGDEPLGVLSILDPSGPVDAGRMEVAESLARHAALTLAQNQSAGALGAVLIEALVRAAATPETLLTTTLSQLAQTASTPEQRELASVAELFQRLSALGDLERELALDLLHDAIHYSEALRARR